MSSRYQPDLTFPEPTERPGNMWGSRLLFWICAVAISWFPIYGVVGVGAMVANSPISFAQSLMWPSFLWVLGGSSAGLWLAGLKAQKHPVVAFLKSSASWWAGSLSLTLGVVLIGGWIWTGGDSLIGLWLGEALTALGGTTLLYRWPLDLTYPSPPPDKP